MFVKVSDYEYRCNSNDEKQKSTKDAAINFTATLWEYDTGKLYCYDRIDGVEDWYPCK